MGFITILAAAVVANHSPRTCIYISLNMKSSWFLFHYPSSHRLFASWTIKLYGLEHITTVQLKGNFIPACMLYVENFCVKITSCVQYIWIGIRYIHACIRQIVKCVHPQMLHSFWINFLMKLNINCIHMMNLQIIIVSVCSNRSLNRLSYWKAAHVQLCAVFGIENESFIGDYISINLFAFVQSVGCKVGKYFTNIVCRCLVPLNLRNWITTALQEN